MSECRNRFIINVVKRKPATSYGHKSYNPTYSFVCAKYKFITIHLWAVY